MTLGWLRRAHAWASRKKRARSSSVTAMSLEMTFRATIRSSIGSWALYTVPMPPRPMRSTTRYLPSRWIMPCAKGSGGSAAEAHEEGAHVVAAALRVGLGHELAARALEVTFAGGDDLDDPRVGEHVGQPVGAEEQDVAGLEWAGDHVELDVLARAQGLGQHVLHHRG